MSELGKQLITALQHRLKEKRWYRGKLDGISGALTSSAIVDFKQAHNLRARDFVGPVTLGRLFSEDAKAAPAPKRKRGEPLWLAEARRLLGTREAPGKRNNPVIMDWADDLDQWYPGDDVPWCGLFVAHCMHVGAPGEPQDFNRLGARNWLDYGDPIDPKVGAICVFWRTHRTRSWNGHVGFIVGEDKSAYHVLGGNQSDAVTITRISKSRLLGCRAPEGWSGGSSVLESVVSGKLSTNEA
ncbi:MAG: TIGR02594 family protein [Ahrensia sp.]|nr:TIGR02594 family protein [Ahrensia sp.]